jgi:hypothetical protein
MWSNAQFQRPDSSAKAVVAMQDVVMLAIGAAFGVATWLLILVCERLMGDAP